MFLSHEATVADFNEEMYNIKNFSSRKKFLYGKNIHKTLNQMIMEDSSKSENFDEEPTTRKLNSWVLNHKNSKIEYVTEKVNKQPTFYHAEPKKKSVISYRIKDNLAVNKKIIKRLINQSYKSWLRTEQVIQDTTILNNPMLMTLHVGLNSTIFSFDTDYFKNCSNYKGKIMLYGLHKNFPDTRPMKCPYKSVRYSTHLNQGSTVFPRKNIPPNLQKRCICEHFTIIKSPLK